MEEFVYRAINIRILLSSGFSENAAVFLAPLPFGIAHFHHLFSLRDDIDAMKREIPKKSNLMRLLNSISIYLYYRFWNLFWVCIA